MKEAIVMAISSRDILDRVYKEHCCKCHSRHKLNCEYENCSKETFEEWEETARQEIMEELRPSGEI